MSPCLVELLQRRDHRQHDPELLACRGLQQRRELIVQQIRPPQPEPNASDAKCRIGFRLLLPGGRLVAPDVERPEDDRSSRQGRADPAVGGQLLPRSRRRVAADEQQFGPNEPDAIGAGSGRRLCLESRADVRRDRDDWRPGFRWPIGRSRDRSSGSKRRRERRKLVVVGVDEQPPLGPVHGAVEARREVIDGRTEPEDERDPERPGDDRRMSGGRSARKRDPAHELAPEGRHCRWIQVACDQDGRLTVAVPEIGLRLPPDQPRDPAAHVADVGSALPEVIVVHRCQALRLLIGRSQDRLIGGDAGIDQRQRRLDDPRIAREQRLGLEDRPDVHAGARRQLGGQRLELRRRQFEGIDQAVPFVAGRRASGPIPASRGVDRQQLARADAG